MKITRLRVFKPGALIMAALLFFQTPSARAETNPLSSPLENQQPETSTYTAPQNLTEIQSEPTTDFLMDAPLSAATDEETGVLVSEGDAAEILRQADLYDKELDGEMESAKTVLEGLESELSVKYPDNIVSRTVLPGLKEALSDVRRRCEEAMTLLRDLLSQYESADGEDEKAELFQSMEAIKQDMDPSNEDTATLGGQALYNQSEVEYWDALTKRLVRIWDTASAAYEQISFRVDGLMAQAEALKARFAELGRLHPGTILEKFVLERIQGLEDIALKIREDVANVETQYRVILASRDANDLERGKLPNFLTAVEKFLNADTLSTYPGEMNYYESEALYMEDLALKFGDSWNLAKSYYAAILAQEPVLSDLQSRLSASALSGPETAGLLEEVAGAIQDLQESKQAAETLKADILNSRETKSIEVWMGDLEKLGGLYRAGGAAALQIESLKQSVENLEASVPKPDLKKADPKIRKAAEKVYRNLLRTAHLALRYTARSEERVEGWSEIKPSLLKSKEYEKYSLGVENIRAVITGMIAEASALLAQINGEFDDPKKAEILLRELKAKDSKLSLYWKNTGKPFLQEDLQKLKKKFRSK